VSRRRAARTAVALVTGSIIAAGCGGGNPTVATSIDVFAAASLTDAFAELADAYEQTSPAVTVRLNLAGSNALATQLIEGAPGDVFASADTATMDRAQQGGVVDNPTVFAQNHLALVVAEGNPGEVGSLQDLARDDLTVVLCAEEVPCGRAARLLLDRSDLVATADSLEPNVRAVLGKVALGEADAGLVYRTDLQSILGREVDEVPLRPDQGVTVELSIGAVTASDRASLGRSFIDFVLSTQGQAILTDLGFDVRT